MSKAINMGKISAKGGLHLLWGLAFSSVISALGVFVLANLLAPSEYGLVAIVLIGPNLLIVFSDWGVNSAIIKFVAQYRSENKSKSVADIVVAGLLFKVISGLVLSFVSLFLSGFLAVTIFERPDIAHLIPIASFVILGKALLSASQSVFTGFERMQYNGLTQICYALLKDFLSPVLVILGFGVYGAIVGRTVAVILVGIFGVLLLFQVLYKNLTNEDETRELQFFKSVKKLVKYGFPLSVSSILVGFSSQFYIFYVVKWVSDQTMGSYQVATNFLVLITFFSQPLATVLFPAFSKLNFSKEVETLQNIFQFSVKFSTFFVVPAAVAMMTLSNPAVFVLFGERYVETPLFLTLLSIGFLLVVAGNLSVGNLINSQGGTRVTLKLALITVSVGIPLSLMLIPNFGIIGLILTNLFSTIPSIIISLWYVKNQFKVSVDWFSSVKILLATAFASIGTVGILSLLRLTAWTQLIVGFVFFVTIYVLTASLMGVINEDDVLNLREVGKGLGLFSHLFNLFLKIIEKINGLKKNR